MTDEPKDDNLLDLVGQIQRLSVSDDRPLIHLMHKAVLPDSVCGLMADDNNPLMLRGPAAFRRTSGPRCVVCQDWMDRNIGIVEFPR